MRRDAGTTAAPGEAGFASIVVRPERAGVAHSVERNLAKVEVAGSKPVSRSSGTYSKSGEVGSAARVAALERLRAELAPEIRGQLLVQPVVEVADVAVARHLQDDASGRPAEHRLEVLLE